ncbi:hypothetical protein [Agrobacterium cavarae]|uniref:hypothetical protein n=1 Tax=Agrobacterium cavarae TaxID=2528239 RepID=UPI003EE8001A
MPRVYRADSERVNILGWADDDGNPVDDVPDRFQARYLYTVTRTGEVYLSVTPLAHGFYLKMADAVALGFSSEEYLKLCNWENQSSRHIESEDELNWLFRDEENEYFTPPYPRYPL